MAIENKWVKIGTYILLGLMIIGFSVPGFIEFGDESQNKLAEPKLCQNDAECYLICSDIPKEVMCTNNLCQQNSCEEQAVFDYNASKPLVFRMNIFVDGKKIDLTNRSTSKNIFVRFSEDKQFSAGEFADKVSLYSSGLNLGHVLEKVNMKIDTQCLTIDEEKYCQDEKQELNISVNGSETFDYGYYVPKENDVIAVSYGEKS